MLFSSHGDCYLLIGSIPVDVVVAVAVSGHKVSCVPTTVVLSAIASQTHPQQNMIASGSIDSDLTVKVWVDRDAT